MVNEIKIFEKEEFGRIRTAGTAEEPLFCLADVCKALELTPSKVAQRLEKDVLSKYPLQTAGGIQELNFVNEDGLYDVILDSRKPEAKAFRKWITSEVIPSIRKTGGYIKIDDNLSDEEVMERAQNALNYAIERYRIKSQKDADDIKDLRLLADMFFSTKQTMGLKEFNKIINQNGIGLTFDEMCKWMHNEKWLAKESGKSRKYTASMKSIVFQYMRIERVLADPNNFKPNSVIIPKVVLTNKGAGFFMLQLALQQENGKLKELGYIGTEKRDTIYRPEIKRSK